MDAPVFRLPASPGTPLFPVSPERANRQQSIPQSPSLPTGFSIRSPNDVFGSPGRVSDVQGKVAQFNNLNKESTQKRKENEAALKRAVVGREEAESEMRRLREANSELKKQITEYERRERKVGLRLENKMVSSIQRHTTAMLTDSLGGVTQNRRRQAKGDRRYPKVERDFVAF